MTPVASSLRAARAVLADAKSLYVSACAAEIEVLPDLLLESPPTGATVTGLFSPLVNQRAYALPEIQLRARTFLLTRALKIRMAEGWVDYCPWRYSMIDRWMSASGRFDTAAIMISPPDANGMCSLGVQSDFFPALHGQVARIVGFINPRMPRSSGHRQISIDELSVAVDYDVPLLTMEMRAADCASASIARTIAGMVPDGATIQLGTGQIPSEVLAQLKDHRNLKVHTGIIDDNILKLEDSGALDRSLPIVTGTAIGSPGLYDALADPRRFAMSPVSFTHTYANIVRPERFTAINSVLQIDLLGQASGEAIGGRIAASPGGLPDFTRGAQDSAGGQSIVAVRASGGVGKHDGIVPLIDNPAVVTVSAADAHIFVSEFGAVNVRGMSMDRRAEAIISISAPESRQYLFDTWTALRSQLFGRVVARQSDDAAR